MNFYILNNKFGGTSIDGLRRSVIPNQPTNSINKHEFYEYMDNKFRDIANKLDLIYDYLKECKVRDESSVERHTLQINKNRKHEYSKQCRKLSDETSQRQQIKVRHTEPEKLEKKHGSNHNSYSIEDIKQRLKMRYKSNTETLVIRQDLEEENNSSSHVIVENSNEKQNKLNKKDQILIKSLNQQYSSLSKEDTDNLSRQEWVNRQFEIFYRYGALLK